MRIRKKPWARPELDSCSFFEKFPKNLKGCWKSKFYSDDVPLNLELGCGKGMFLAKLASSNPKVGYIGVDIKDEMLVLAKRNIEKEYTKKQLPIKNVILTAYDIARIEDIFSKEDVIDRIYINFCNPWPKQKHKKRRLTHPHQLLQYRNFLKSGGNIYFKTDDDDLFSDSITYFKNCNFDICYKTSDLCTDDAYSSIATEHEKMFRSMGKTIKFLVARKL